MKIIPLKKDYLLSGSCIDEVSSDLQEFLDSIGTQRKNAIASRLTVENILLDWQEHFGQDTVFTYTKNRFLGKPFITLSVKGEAFNPLEKDDDDFGDFSSSLIQNNDYTPSYNYSKGVNTITMRFSKKEMNPIWKLLIAIVAAVLFSLSKKAIPDSAIVFLKDNILNPLYNTFLGIMATVEIPLVFFSITSGIIGIGDSTTFGRIGRKLVLRFLAVILAFTSIAGVVCGAIFIHFEGDANITAIVTGGIDLLLDIIPKSLIDPFTSGNTMQIVIIAILIGITLVVLGEKSKTLSTLTYEANRLIIHITALISKLLPVFIFIVFLNMIWSGNIHLFINMWKPILAYILIILALISVKFARVVIKEKVKPMVLIKKMLPTFLIGFGTASSTAANGECSDSLHRLMGVNNRFVEFGQPVGSTVFMPSTAINFIVCSIYMANYYDVHTSLTWLVIAVLLSSFVAIATPPVAGGAIAAYSIIFSQLGIPTDALAIVVAIDILFDFIATGFDGSFLQLELIKQADENNMLNVDILRK